MDYTLAFKDKYTVEDLVKIMEILRVRCPWDKEQTHESIRKNFIEETYEVVEAIDTGDADLLKEELGDVLLQVVFHSQIETEKGTFRFEDVVEGICRKLILRHPHIFGNVIAGNAEEVLRNWETIKKAEKGIENTAHSMRRIPKMLPALMRSYKVQKKAADVGFDWDDVGGAFDKLYEEIEELKRAVEEGDLAQQEEEIGDLLFSVVNISRFLKVEPEKSLAGAVDKFIERFSAVEEMAKEIGMDMTKATIEELDELWERAKEKGFQQEPKSNCEIK